MPLGQSLSPAGFSGSLYAVKDYYRYNPLIVPEGEDGDAWLREFAAFCDGYGIGVMREQLVAEVKRLRGGIRLHRDSTGHDLCWHHPALYARLAANAVTSAAEPVSAAIAKAVLCSENEDAAAAQARPNT